MNYLLITILLCTCKNTKHEAQGFNGINTEILSEKLKIANQLLFDIEEIVIPKMNVKKELFISEVIDSIWFIKLEKSRKRFINNNGKY